MSVAAKSVAHSAARLGAAPRMLPIRPAVRLTKIASYKDNLPKTPKTPEIDPKEVQDQATKIFNDTTKFVQTTWENTEEKPAAVAITMSAFLALWALNSVVEAVDRLPLFGGLFEMVGIIVTGWFIYRYLIFGPDREELVETIKKFMAKVSGSKGSRSSSSSSTKSY